MKGTIVRCLCEMIEKAHGADTWARIMETAGHRTGKLAITMDIVDVDDALVMGLVQATCTVLGITAGQAANAFGEYWSCTFGPANYPKIYERFHSAREMLLGMDQVHIEVTSSVPNARPPRFDYAWSDPRTLNVSYKSNRGMVEIFAGLARGVGKHFNEPLDVTVRDAGSVQIVFAA